MNTHILIVADGRSPTARSWIANIQALGFTVSLISTFACDPPDGLRHCFILPVALSRLSSATPTSTPSLANPAALSPGRRAVSRFAPLLQELRYFLGPLTIPRFAYIYKKLVRELNPDLVHALRIPFEGMLASYTPKNIRFLGAIWGNDLTLHASGSFLMRAFTKRCLHRADGLSADTQRDIRLAFTWGLSKDAATLVVPGSGGLDLQAIREAPPFNSADFDLPTDKDWVVNPRGLRPGSIHQEVFFAAMPAILSGQPKTVFICPGLAGNAQVQAWMKTYHVEENIFLLPKLPQAQLWSLFKGAKVFVSPSSHDGTPNSLLEAMACGCFPVVGNIESLREWIHDGENGLLINPQESQALAEAVCHALESPALRKKAAEQNLALVKERAAQEVTRPMITAYYGQFTQ